MLNNSEKKSQIYWIQFLASTWYTNKPMKIFWKDLLGLARKVRSKEATWSKNENSVTHKKIILQLFKWKSFTFMTYGQFPPKIAQNWDLLSKIQWFERAQLRLSNPWISNDKSHLIAIFRRKLTIGHKSKWSSLKKLIYNLLFGSTEFSFFGQAASFDLNFLVRPNRFFQNIFMASLVYQVYATNCIH